MAGTSRSAGFRPTRAGGSIEARRAGDDGGKTWSYRSRDGEKILFLDLVAHQYLPSIKDDAPKTRKNTASHLGDGTGVPVRNG